VRKSLLASVSWLALASGAAAQDNAPVVWQGFYIGINGGIGSHDASVRADDDIDNIDTGDLSPIGGIVGGHAGYNFQHQHFIFGVEADASWVDGDDSGTTVNGAAWSTDLEWLVTIRGRVGVALSPTLIYVTGGFAAGEVSNSLPGDFGVTFPADNDTRTGVVFGGGIEHMLSPRVLVRGEILHVDLGDNSVVSFAGPLYNARFENDVTLGRVGVSLKW
jgi:outer membrane immunogenic protein